MKLLTGILALVSLTTGQRAFAACDQSGIGKASPNSSEARLNILKNRRAQPTTVQPVSISQMLAYPAHYDSSLEASNAVVLTGQLIGTRHERGESPNCGVETDYHIWVGPIDAAHPMGARLTKAQVKARKMHAVVVELTPNIQDLHPTWGPHFQRRLAGKNVCISGWLLYDPAHPPQLGHTRGTLWEVHPITGIALLQPDGSCTPWAP
jgi:hypothetical protein